MQKVLGSIRRVRFTKSTPRQASIQEKKGLSLVKMNVKVPHQRSPYALKFEDRSHEETEQQQRCARSKAWNFAKNIYKLKDNDKAAFYFPTEEWVLSAASTKEPGGKRVCGRFRSEYASGQQRDLRSALKTMRISKYPMMVMTANGEVQTREEATENVKELDLFVTVMLLEETLAVLSLGKLCEDQWVYPPLDQRSKTTSHQKGQEN